MQLRCCASFAGTARPHSVGITAVEPGVRRSWPAPSAPAMPAPAPALEGFGSLCDRARLIHCLKFGNPMRRSSVHGLLVAWLFTGCSTGPQHLSSSQFQRRYMESQTAAMEHYSYSGETNGLVYISRIHLPRFYYSKLKWQTLFTETNGLPPESLQLIRSGAKAESGRRED